MEQMHVDVYTYTYKFHSPAVCDYVSVCAYIWQRWGPERERGQKIFKSVY